MNDPMDPKVRAALTDSHKRIHAERGCLCPTCNPELHAMLNSLYQDEGGEA